MSLGIWVLIIMTAITVANKSLFLLLGSRVNFSPRVREAFGLVPVAVLAGLIAPMVVRAPAGDMIFSPDKLIAVAVALLVAYRSKNMLLTLAAGGGLLYLLHHIHYSF